MSVLIALTVPGDTDVFAKALVDRADDFVRIADGARQKGAIHHRFGLGDGSVLVIDEWESIEKFHAFFADPELQAFIGEVGGDTSAEPNLSFAEAVSSADQF